LIKIKEAAISRRKVAEVRSALKEGLNNLMKQLSTTSDDPTKDTSKK